MIRTVITCIFAFLLVPLSAYAQVNCYSCHGQKGARTYVDRSVLEQSSHGALSCNKCHFDVAAFPHGKVAKVNCNICHLLGKDGAPRDKAREYQLSVHGKSAASGNPMAPTCQTCHGSHAVFPSRDLRSATQRQKIPALCSTCHPKEFEEYSKSVHGDALLKRSNPGAPSCFDCHLEHLVPRTDDPQWKLSLIKQCGNCHAEEMNTYHKTFHGKVTQLGYATMAKCSDCHGSHTILPPKNSASKLSAQNILATCRTCHARATEGFTKFYAHAEEGNREKYPVLYYTYWFMTLLLIGTFSFFFAHTFLWAYRSLRERMKNKGGA